MHFNHMKEFDHICLYFHSPFAVVEMIDMAYTRITVVFTKGCSYVIVLVHVLTKCSNTHSGCITHCDHSSANISVLQELYTVYRYSCSHTLS